MLKKILLPAILMALSSGLFCMRSAIQGPVVGTVKKAETTIFGPGTSSIDQKIANLNNQIDELDKQIKIAEAKMAKANVFEKEAIDKAEIQPKRTKILDLDRQKKELEYSKKVGRG